MKILFISNSGIFGGAENYAFRVAGAITERGLPIQVVTAPAVRLATKLRSAGVHTEEINLGVAMGRVRGYLGTLALLDPLGGRRLRNLLLEKRREGFDCLVLQDPREQILASAYAKQLGFRVIWIVHSPLHYPLHRIVGYKLLCRAAAFAERVIVICEYTKKNLLAAGLPSDRIEVIPPFIDLDLIDREVSQSKYTGGQRIAYVGRLAHSKGVETLLNAMPLVIQEAPDVEVFIAGTGPAKSHLIKLAAKLGLESRVHFLGFIDDPITVLTQIDILVNLSFDPGETLPGNVLEAFAASRAVVATNHAGSSEMVKHEETGLLISKRDPMALAQVLLRLMQNPAWSRKLGAQGRSSLMSKYPFVIDRLLACFSGSASPTL